MEEDEEAKEKLGNFISLRTRDDKLVPEFSHLVAKLRILRFIVGTGNSARAQTASETNGGKS